LGLVLLWRGAVAYRVAVVLVCGGGGSLAALKLLAHVPEFPPQATVFVALGVGAVFGALASFLERAVVTLVGACLGAVIVNLFTNDLRALAAGATSGALLLGFAFDPLLKLITSAVGALLVASAVGQASPVLWVAFTAAGLAIQAGIGREEPEPE